MKCFCFKLLYSTENCEAVSNRDVYIFMYGFHVRKCSMLSQSSFLFSITCTLSFHMRDGDHSIVSRQMESTVLTLKRWSPKKLLVSQQHLLTTNSVIHTRDVALFLFPLVRGEAGNDTGHRFLFPLLFHQ